MTTRATLYFYRTRLQLKLVIGLICLASCPLLSLSAPAQNNSQKKNGTEAKKAPPFSWVNPLKKNDVSGLKHETFRSESMGVDVGYCIYLPSAYFDDAKAADKFNVIYYLHGGRPGNEIKSVKLVDLLHANIESGKVTPMIYVFVNGGPVSHYNMPEMKNGMGEDVFIKELIPHIDKTYRTIADRSGRGIEGFSQGGRGTARIMFRHSDLFCSAAPGGGGYETEKKISENNGYENENLKFTEGYNTWDLAREYAKQLKAESKSQELRIQFHVGTKGFNYENNLAYMEFLDSLGISYDKVIVKNATHSAQQIYAAKGLEIMKFHADNFANLN